MNFGDKVSIGSINIHYNTTKSWQKPERVATWELIGQDAYGGIHVNEKDVPLARIIWIAELIGQRGRVIELMQAEADALKKTSDERIQRVRNTAMEEETKAVEEQRQRAKILRELRSFT